MRVTFLVATCACLALIAPAFAAAPVVSPRPDVRPDLAVVAAVTASSQGTGLAVARSLRPVLRGTPASTAQPPRALPQDFVVWRDTFRADALAQGIRPEIFDRAFAGVTPRPRVINSDSTQAEFARSLADYLDGAVSDVRIANGRAELARNGEILALIEDRYGVDAKIVLAIWGLETAYGALSGKNSAIEAMATLAHEGRRRSYFEAELIAALQILQAGDVAPGQMTGSWAGAMGHTQFMPTSYLAYAVDFDGDGRRDIWSENPVDALASTANYLRENGWVTGQPWAVEVRLPDGFDYTQAGKETIRSAGYWQHQGVRLADGGPLLDHGPGAILLAAGHRGVALMIYDNFHVISRYNASNSYVIGVGHLADRIMGSTPFRATWPRDARGLSRPEREELQRHLAARGLHDGKIDGIIGPQTALSIRRFQASVGMVPDGFASLAVLERMR